MKRKEMIDKEIKHNDNSSGITGVVLGILSILSGAPGLVLGLIGFLFSFNQYKNHKNKWAVWGLTLNIIGFVLAAVFAIVLYNSVSGAVANLQGLSQAN